jgi:hypothetical protein
LCIECGDATNRRIPLARYFAHEIGGQPTAEPPLILLLSLPGIFVSLVIWIVWVLILRQNMPGERAVTGAKFRLPQCESCKGKEPRIVEQYPERKQLKLVVHRKFGVAFETENAKRRAR